MIKDIAVQLTGSEEDDVRLSFAQVIASHFGAHLLGVHLHALPDILASTDPSLSGYIQTLLEESNAAADRAHEGLKARLSTLNGSTELRRLHGLAAGVGADLARIAREVDLFVGTRPYGDPDARYLIEEAVLFGSGRGCLFLPPGGTPQKSFKTVLIAWDGSREAARALAEAMPFLQQATNVFLATIVDSDQSESKVKSASAGILAHLDRHGIHANLSQASYRSSAGEQIEEMAHQRGADLIVMGAYGHSRFVEWALGGATRYLLRHSTLPVLMAH